MPRFAVAVVRHSIWHQPAGWIVVGTTPADHPIHHAVLLWRVRRDELLLQTVAFYQHGVAAAGK